MKNYFLTGLIFFSFIWSSCMDNQTDDHHDNDSGGSEAPYKEPENVDPDNTSVSTGGEMNNEGGSTTVPDTVIKGTKVK